jgi:hypothetical protein
MRKYSRLCQHTLACLQRVSFLQSICALKRLPITSPLPPLDLLPATVHLEPFAVMCVSFAVSCHVYQRALRVVDGVQLKWQHASRSPETDPAWKADLSLLSGGQRSLVAIALLIAVNFSMQTPAHHYVKFTTL